MRRYIAVILTAFLLACAPLSAYAQDGERYGLDERVVDYDFEEYYPKGRWDEANGAVRLDGGSVSMKVGQTRDLSEGRIYHSSDKDLQIIIVSGPNWASTEPGVASVDANGMVTAHRVGYAHITATYHDNRAYKVI